MSNPVIPESAESCVWMSAGLLDYKLCDRDFDCERCPLDAALRGESLECPVRRALMGPSLSSGFPEDRLYSTGHTWLQDRGVDGNCTLRLGVDTFAAAIIGHCDAARWHVSDQTLQLRETLCEIDLGIGFLPLGAPISGVVVRGNRALQRDPSQLVTQPYGEGWILDLAVENTAELQGCSRPKQRGSWRVWIYGDFDDASRYSFSQPRTRPVRAWRTGELLTDLRKMLGGSSYLDLLRSIH